MKGLLMKNSVPELMKNLMLLSGELSFDGERMVRDENTVDGSVSDAVELIDFLLGHSAGIWQYKAIVRNEDTRDFYASYVLANSEDEASRVITDHYDELFYNELTGELDMYSHYLESVPFVTSKRNTVPQLKPGMVVETMGYHLITREDENFIYAKEVKPYLELDDEMILFTKNNIEKEWSAIEPIGIIDMNEVTKRYLELA